jgi:membrane protease YdiL (CAAX protease family)
MTDAALAEKLGVTSRFALRHDLREPIILSATLVAYSNGLTALAHARGKDPERAYLFGNPVMLLSLLWYASRRPGGLGAVGLNRRGLPRSLVLGIATGGLLSIIPLLFFHKPLLLDTPLEYGPVITMTRRDLVKDIGLRVPVNIAFLEELAFRGLLYDSLRTRYSEKAAIVGSAIAFACWHLSVLHATTTGQTNLAGAARLPSFLRPFIPAIAVLGGVVSTGIAGAAFALVRKQTGSLAGPIAAHWLADGLMIASLWRSAQRRATRSVPVSGA